MDDCSYSSAFQGVCRATIKKREKEGWVALASTTLHAMIEI
jgi:hypothetical protein